MLRDERTEQQGRQPVLGDAVRDVKPRVTCVLRHHEVRLVTGLTVGHSPRTSSFPIPFLARLPGDWPASPGTGPANRGLARLTGDWPGQPAASVTRLAYHAAREHPFYPRIEGREKILVKKARHRRANVPSGKKSSRSFCLD